MKKKAIILLISIFTLLTLFTLTVQADSIYYVRTGDTLWEIANKFDVTVDMLFRNNKIDNNWLYVGQKLIIKDTGNSGNPHVYYVKTGDTLWKIAQKYNITVEDIIEINNLTDYTLYIGQKLYLDKSSNNNDNNGPEYRYHTIKAGDILWNIAQKYGTTVQKLVELNDIRDAYDLYIGRKLIVPVKQSDNNAGNDTTPVGNLPDPYFFYRVNAGDKVWAIADRFGVRVSEIINFNDLDNVNNIEEGTILVIPLQKSNKLAYIKRASSVLNNSYRVDGNDTLSSIAEYYNIAEEGLRAINHLNTNENIYTGQKLLMPVSPALFAEHKLYTVKQGGEYIFDIAYNHGVSIKSILKANYLKNPNLKLDAGSKIIISLTEESKITWIDYENGKPVNSWIF